MSEICSTSRRVFASNPCIDPKYERTRFRSSAALPT